MKTLRATGIYYSPFVNEPPDKYAHRRLIVEVDGDVLRMETAATSATERDQPFGSPGVTLEVDLEQVPLLIERIAAALAEALADRPLPPGLFAVHGVKVHKTS